MLATPQNRMVWAVILTILGVLAAALLFALTKDVIWSLVPLLLAISAVRCVLHRGDKPTKHDTTTR